MGILSSRKRYKSSWQGQKWCNFYLSFKGWTGVQQINKRMKIEGQMQTQKLHGIFEKWQQVTMSET